MIYRYYLHTYTLKLSCPSPKLYEVDGVYHLFSSLFITYQIITHFFTTTYIHIYYHCDVMKHAVATRCHANHRSDLLL